LSDETEEILTTKDYWDILEFSRAVSSIYPGVFTPDIVNSRMKEIGFINGAAISEASVATALADPKNHERELLGMSEALEVKSTPYKRILQYMASLPAFDLTYNCINIKDFKDYKSPKYQKDLDVVKEFLDRFDYKVQFASVLKQLFREETFFASFRDEGEKYVLQQLPSDFSKITGRYEYGLLFSFNFAWFLNAGVDIELFSPIFKKIFANLVTSGRDKYRPYTPSIDINDRSNNLFALWADLSPNDGQWAWKLDSANIMRVPFFAGLFQDFSAQDLIRGLQRSNYLASSMKLIMGQIALLNKEQKSTTKDAFSISPDLLGKFLQLVKTAISNESVKIASLPLEEVKTIQFETDNDIYASYLRTTLGSSGINSNLIFNSNVKANAIETQLSASVDEFISTSVYGQFNRFMEYQINKRTKNYKFNIHFEGSNFYLDRDRRLKTQMTLLDKGIANPQKIAAAIGQNPFVFQEQLDSARAQGWIDNLTPILSQVMQNQPGQSSGKNPDSTGGRPRKDESELTDEGEQTRQDGGNLSKGGKI
jgi:hypothetical protein